MNRRATRSRPHLIRIAAAMMVIAILVASGAYLVPLANQWLSNSARTTRTVVATDDVNLRSGPGTSYDVITVIPTGTEISAERESVNGFSAVNLDGERGWIASEYLAQPGVASAAEYQAPESGSVQSEPTIVESAPAPTREPVIVAPVPTAVPTAQPVIAQSTQVQAEPQPGENWISVNRTNRTVTLHKGEIIVATFDALIGKDLSADGYYSTAIGTYYVHVKEKALAETPFADGVYLTDFVGFDPVRSNGFHSPTRDEFGNIIVTGGTSTLGCVRLGETDAQLLFDFAHIGMRVEIRD